MIKAQQTVVGAVTPISYEQAQAQQVQPLTVQAQWIQAVVGVIMTIWLGVFVLQQVVRVFKGEEVEKPPLALTKGLR